MLAFLKSAFFFLISFGYLLHISWQHEQVLKCWWREGAASTGRLCQGDPGIGEVSNVTAKPPSVPESPCVIWSHGLKPLGTPWGGRCWSLIRKNLASWWPWGPHLPTTKALYSGPQDFKAESTIMPMFLFKNLKLTGNIFSIFPSPPPPSPSLSFIFSTMLYFPVRAGPGS